MTPSSYARAAAVLFAVEAIFPIAHRLAGAEYRGLTHTFTVVVDVGIAIVWIAAAIAGFLQRSSFGLSVMFVGAAVSLIHGFNFSVATSSVGPYGVGIPFVLVAAVQTYLTVLGAPAFRPTAIAEGATEAEPGAHTFGDRVRAALAPRARHSA
jgi:hypothetical protein